MELIEIILIILGIAAILASFVMPRGTTANTQEQEKSAEETVKKLIDQEMEGAKGRIGDIVDETITYAMEKTERAMERLSNEKILSMNEYSDTVLDQINKNHQEAVFLYDMLNDKQESLKAAVSQAAKTVTEVKQTTQDAEAAARKVVEQEAKKESKPRRTRAQKEGSFGDKASGGGAGSEASGEPFSVSEGPLSPEAENDFVALTPPRALVMAPEKEGTEENGKDTLPGAGESSSVPEIAVSLNAEGKAGRNSNDQILELHKAGKSNMAIAKELGLGIGEVKLVIDLFEGV